MEDSKPRAALLLVHGIGEQRPYETLDAFARGLVRAHARSGPLRLTPRNVEWADGTGTCLRIEGLASFEHLDVVELHWSGLAHGKIGALGVLSWLVRTGVAPLDFAHQLPLLRGDGHPGHAAVREALNVLMLLTVASLALMGILWVASLVPTAARFGWAVVETVTLGRLAAFVAVFAPASTAVALGTGIVRSWGRARAIGRRHDGAWRGASFGRLASLAPALAASAVAALLLAVGLAWLLRDPLATWWWELEDAARLLEQGRLGLALVVSAGAWIASRWITDYLGDLVLYVTADDRAVRSETRRRIKRAAGDRLRELLEGPWEQVFVAGHSLGSVIAYDCLNDLVRDLRADAISQSAAGRLQGLLTFGSPLDKVHTLFRERVRDEQAVRAQLLSFLHALRKRPSLRDDGPFRFAPYDVPLEGFIWLNVSTPLDFVSDHLRHYRVDVQRTLRARNPLSAHAAYWRSDDFFAWVLAWLDGGD